jgi:hypothetical protein
MNPDSSSGFPMAPPLSSASLWSTKPLSLRASRVRPLSPCHHASMPPRGSAALTFAQAAGRFAPLHCLCLALVSSGPLVLELCPQLIIRSPYGAPFEFCLSGQPSLWASGPLICIPCQLAHWSADQLIFPSWPPSARHKKTRHSRDGSMGPGCPVPEREAD